MLNKIYYIVLLFVVFSCEFETSLSSKTSRETLKEDLRKIQMDHPEKFKISSFNTCLDYFEACFNLIDDKSYEEAFDILDDTLQWAAKLESFDKVNKVLLKYSRRKNQLYVITKTGDKVDFAKTIWKTVDQNRMVDPYPNSNPELNIICNSYYFRFKTLMTNNGAYVLGYTTLPAAKANKEEILDYERKRRWVLSADIFFGDKDFYRNDEIVNIGFELSAFNEKEYSDWYDVMHYYYNKLSLDNFYGERNHVLKSSELTGMQPQLWED